MKHTYFKVCPRCGAHLDPDEICDCNQTTSEGGKDHDKD